MISFVSGTMTPEIQETEPTGFYTSKKGIPMIKTTTWMQMALNNRKVDAIKNLRGLCFNPDPGTLSMSLTVAKVIVEDFMNAQRETLGDALKETLGDTLKVGDTVRLMMSFSGYKQGLISKITGVKPATTDGRYLVTIKDGLHCYAHRFEKITKENEIQTLKDKVSLLEDRFQEFTETFDKLKASVVMKPEPLTFENLKIGEILILQGTEFRVDTIEPITKEFFTIRNPHGYGEWWHKAALHKFTRKGA